LSKVVDIIQAVLVEHSQRGAVEYQVISNLRIDIAKQIDNLEREVVLIQNDFTSEKIVEAEVVANV
jgi:hypothetical protein